MNDNWFIFGDFNAFFSAHEKLGRPPNARSCHDFLSYITKCSLTCLDNKGPFYTWSNNRRGIHNVDICLDRALCSDSSFQN